MQKQPRPTSYANFIWPKTSGSPNQSSSSLKHTSASLSTNSNQQHYRPQDQDHNTTLNTLLQRFNDLKKEIRALREDITHLQ